MCREHRAFVLRLFKKNVPLTPATDDTVFDLIAFMHFDNISIVPVENSDFSKYGAIPPEGSYGVKNRFNYERRRINFYTFDEADIPKATVVHSGEAVMPQIFDSNSHENYPVLLISLLELNGDSKDAIRALDKELNLRTSSVSAEFAWFGSLGLADAILVMRTATFFDAFSLLETVYSATTLRSTYSIPAMVKRLWNRWNEPVQPHVSIRIAMSPDSNIRKLEALVKEIEETRAIASLKRTRVLGKFDMEITGEIANTRRFAQLFFERKDLLNAHADHADQIAQTNTRILIQD